MIKFEFLTIYFLFYLSFYPLWTDLLQKTEYQRGFWHFVEQMWQLGKFFIKNGRFRGPIGGVKP
jgi:hypothetical protein